MLVCMGGGTRARARNALVCCFKVLCTDCSAHCASIHTEQQLWWQRSQLRCRHQLPHLLEQLHRLWYRESSSSSGGGGGGGITRFIACMHVLVRVLIHPAPCHTCACTCRFFWLPKPCIPCCGDQPSDRQASVHTRHGARVP